MEIHARGIARAASTFVFVLLLAINMAAAGQVRTEAGTVEGSTSADGKVQIFKGIPYAAPPTGALRWKEPQPVAKWKGVRKAAEFGARCMQGNVFGDMVFRDAGPSEDCLYLNVWTPKAATEAKLPVMVWIYGGGFQAGATSEPRQEGEHLAHKGVVVVSMNYRLGIFFWILLAPRADQRIAAPCFGKLWTAGSSGSSGMGAQKHRGVWRRSGKRNDFWRVGGIVFCKRADGFAGFKGTDSSRDRGKRSVLWKDFEREAVGGKRKGCG